MNNISCYLLDMDGTIYLSDQLIDGTLEFLEKLKKEKYRYFFLTNNSSKNKYSYADKLNTLGISAEPSDIFTSGEATTIYLNKINPGAKIFLLGTKCLQDEFENAGFTLVSDNTPADYVVLGFDTTINYEKIWLACDQIFSGVPFIATHPDYNCPLGDGKCMPDCGAMIKMFEASTGVSPIIIGKPNKTIIDMLCEKHSIDSDSMMMVGDRLYTDILLGKNAGIKTALVLSGETTLSEYKKSAIKADYVFSSIKELLCI